MKQFFWTPWRDTCLPIWKRGNKMLTPDWKKIYHSRAKVIGIQLVITVLGIVAAFGVGAFLYHNALQSQVQEYKLKCQNRQEVLRAEMANNLNTSFMVLGLIGNNQVPSEAQWLQFTNTTVFLRSNSPYVTWLQLVKDADRATFEKTYNTSILQPDNNGGKSRRERASEYAPIVLASKDMEKWLYYDFTNSELVNKSLWRAKDNGISAMSQPVIPPGVPGLTSDANESDSKTNGTSTWLVGIYFPVYRSATPATVEGRRASCIGWIAISLQLDQVFGIVLERYKDDESVDVVLVFKPETKDDWLKEYNCTRTTKVCRPVIYDPAGRMIHGGDHATSVVSWEYGSQKFEIRCYARRNLKLFTLRIILAWPLLMMIVVLLSTIILYLALKRMQAIWIHVQQVEKMNSDLIIAKSTAESADKAKSRFLATVSHEIRTPMNGVIGMTNLLMSTELNKQQQEYIKIAQASGNALVGLINEVLDLSKIEAGKMELECVPFDLHEELDDVICLFEEKVHQKQLELCALIHDTAPKFIFGDPGRLRQVLINLVGNAMKFTKEGSVVVCVRAVEKTADNLGRDESDHQQRDGSTFAGSKTSLARIPEDPNMALANSDVGGGEFSDTSRTQTRDSYMSRETSGHLEGEQASSALLSSPPRLGMQPGFYSSKRAVEMWRSWGRAVAGRENGPGEANVDNRRAMTLAISVEDTGIGIPPHLRHRLFEPFQQADSSTSREFGGTGIGLSISKKLVELMGGKLTVGSGGERGTVFEFSVEVEVAGNGINEKRSDTEGKSKLPPMAPQLKVENLRGVKVLLIDKHAVRQEVLASYLRRVGVVVEGAEDKQSALDTLLLNATQPAAPFRAVILDLQGVELSSALQVVKEAIRIKVAVLIVTTGLSAEKKKQLEDGGVVQTLLKPIRATTLAREMLQALGMGGQAPQALVNTNSKMLDGKRVLVVDDNLVNRKVARAMLLRYGATVECVDGGQQALCALQSKSKDLQFDLVLMDIQMPEMDGYEATKKIREWERGRCPQCTSSIGTVRLMVDKDPARIDKNLQSSFTEAGNCPHSRVPIVALTADVMTGSLDLCLNAGMDDQLAKPLDQSQLLALLERFLNRNFIRSRADRKRTS